MTVKMELKMTDYAQEIQKLYNEGRIYEGVQLARRQIEDVGVENAQLEAFLLAKGLYAGMGDLHGAYFWLQRTNADPINRIPFTEKIERKLGILPYA